MPIADIGYACVARRAMQFGHIQSFIAWPLEPDTTLAGVANGPKGLATTVVALQTPTTGNWHPSLSDLGPKAGCGKSACPV
jgi:hypothetical protein